MTVSRCLWWVLCTCAPARIPAQSLEIMAGHQGIFTDAQWFSTFGKDRKWSVFSRTRATVDYEQHTDPFTGTYLNFTTRSGLGGSVVGKISSANAGADAGAHFLNISKSWTHFLLVSAGLKRPFEYSWFSVSRFTPPLSERLKLYTSLELFTLVREGRHVVSVQRLRAGLQQGQLEYGAAANLGETGRVRTVTTNFGLFLRKSF